MAQRLTKPEAGVAHTPQSWSPDGAHLLLSARVQKGEQSRLWTLAVGDGKLTPYGDMESREAVFSPDGQWVAYQTPNTVIRDTFIAPFPWTGTRYLVPHVGNGGGQPFWSPKGDEIIMTTGQTRSTVVTVATKPSVSFGQPLDLPRAGRSDPNPAIGRRNTDMLPDGQHMVGVLSASAVVENQGPQITVVLGRFDEVRQRASR